MQIRSIKEIIEKADGIINVEEKIKHLISSAWDIRRSFPKESLELSLQARKIAEEHQLKHDIAYSYRNTGTAYYILSQYSKALIDLEKALAFFKELNDKHAIGSTLRNIGNVYHSMNLYEPSIELYNKAILITESENDEQGTAYNLGNIGHVYQKMKKYDLAKEYLLKAKTILENINDTLGLSDLLNNLGNIFSAEKNIIEAKKCIKKSLELASSIKHLRGEASSHLSLGHLLIKNKDIENAILEFELALKKAEEVGEELLMADILKNLSNAYELLPDYEKALFNHKLYEAKKSELHEVEHQILLDTHDLKSEIEKSYLQNQELEKIKQELEIKNKEFELLSIVASETENAILILDQDGTIEWVNSSFEKLNGMNLAEFRAKYGNTIYEVSNNPEIVNIIQKCISTKASVSYESANVFSDGKVIWESSTLTPIFNEEGNLTKLIIIDSDVTERKQNEEIIKLKNKDIMDSIMYAKHIQEALFPPLNELSKIFAESFLVFKPKDIVSGDFYWFSKTDDVKLMAIADCTGHGVPGAFMSVVGNEMLNISLHDSSVCHPSEALNLLDKKIKAVFSKGRQNNMAQDGMDIGLLVIHNNNFIQYAGARRPLIHIRDKVKQEYAGDKYSIGGVDESSEKCFTDKEFFVQPGDMLYLFSDGYPDQFGGPRGKKIMHKNFTGFLCDISDLPMDVQKEKLENFFEEWRGSLEQIDDVSVVGIRIV
jgi:PAS domain S-box-containing protein